MEEIVKHINDTNASYRALNAGDAKNTDLFLDNEHYEIFKDAGERIIVRFNKENLQKAILFIASILPRKYDNSSVHKTIPFSEVFVLDQLAFLDGFFTQGDIQVETRTQIWNARKDVPQKNGEIDRRFYFNGLLEDVSYKSYTGEIKNAKFTIRNYMAGGYSDLHIKKANDGVFDVWITNVLEPYYDQKEDGREQIDVSRQSLQQIFYGAPGTGKSKTIKDKTEGAEKDGRVFRTTFHPDSDYSTLVGCYKPTTQVASQQAILDYDSLVDRFKKYISDFGNITHASAAIGYDYHDSIVRMQESGIHTIADLLADAHKSGTTYDTTIRSGMLLYEEQVQKGKTSNKISYAFVPQVFTNAYVKAWNTEENVYLIIEEINRGNCAQIFGDLFQLLDRDSDGISEYPIMADKDLAKYLKGKDEDGQDVLTNKDGIKDGKLRLPKNLYIWATMNTSDQSLFPIDSAFKRRWDWTYMKIKNHPEENYKIKLSDKEYDWWKFIQRINEIIASMTSSADKQLGYFFCKATDGGTISPETFVSKVIFYLWNDVFKDYGFEDASLFRYKNDKDEMKDLTFPDFYDEDGEKVNETRLKDFLDKVLTWKKDDNKNND